MIPPLSQIQFVRVEMINWQLRHYFAFPAQQYNSPSVVDISTKSGSTCNNLRLYLNVNPQGRMTAANWMNFRKSSKGGRRIVSNPKNYVADFGNFKQGFLIIKLIQNSNFRYAFLCFRYVFSTKIKTRHTLKKALLNLYAIWPSYLLTYMHCVTIS